MAVRTTVDILGFLPDNFWSIVAFLLIHSWVVGFYVYFREPEIGGVLHRSYDRIVRPFEADDVSVRRLEAALSKNEKRRHVRAGRIFITQLMVGAMASIVAAGISLFVYLILSAPVVTIVAVLVWMVYEVAGSQRKAKLFRRLDRVTEAPQRLLFDFEVIDAGLKGVIVTLFAIFTFVFPILMLSTFVVVFVRLFGAASDQTVGRVLNEILQDPVLILPVLAVVSLLFIGIFLSIYSFVVSYSLINRLSAWLEDTTSTQKKKIPDLPKLMSLTYPVAFFFYFGVVFRILPFISSESADQMDSTQVLVLSVITVAFPFYVVLLYDAYKKIERKAVGEISRVPENDYYRIPLVLSTQMFSLSVAFAATSRRLLGMVYFIFAFNLFYLLPWVLKLCANSVSSDFLGSILGDTYILFIAISIFLAGISLEVFSPLRTAIFCGIVGGILYSSSLIDYFIFSE